MDESLVIAGSGVLHDGSDDIGSELYDAGREVTFGFDALGCLFNGGIAPPMPDGCPNCASTKLLVAIDRRQQHNWYCRTCGRCWHLERGRLRRVDPEMCPGCGLATTDCSEHLEQRAQLTI